MPNCMCRSTYEDIAGQEGDVNRGGRQRGAVEDVFKDSLEVEM